MHRKERIPGQALLPQTQILDAYFGATDSLVVVESDSLLPHHYDDGAAVDLGALQEERLFLILIFVNFYTAEPIIYDIIFDDFSRNFQRKIKVTHQCSEYTGIGWIL